MMHTYSSFRDDDRFIVTDFSCNPSQELFEKAGLYKILWSKDQSISVVVDGYEVQLNPNELIFCTPINVMSVPMDSPGLTAILFNKEFFCIQTHDQQVSCQGFLFFGSAQPQIITIPEDKVGSFDTMYKDLLDDIIEKDHLQGEMLRSTLKRLLISATRLLRRDLSDGMVADHNLNLIREFNLLVEKHFKEYHRVMDYANMLHKSPKTLSNLFNKYIDKSPLAIINERIVLEARRLLLYSDKSNEEIATDLGYKDAGHFAKFFKKHQKFSPSVFRKNKIKVAQ